MAEDMSVGLQLRSTVKKNGTLELSLASVATPEPKPDEVVVRVEASPINPSDMGLLFGMADMSTAAAAGGADNPVVTARVPEGLMRHMAARVDQALPVGNEGAGVVVQTGASDSARALMGKTVAILGGAMYAQYRCIPAAQCLVLPEGQRRPRAPLASSTRSPSWVWSRRCGWKVTARWCIPRPPPTSVRCWSSSATRRR